jgi:F-type H+-transporting ATPase subunit epsilon
MLPSKINLDVATPERLVFSQEVDELILPGSEGYLGVRPGHTPLMVGLGVGMISWRRAGREGHMAVSLGYAEVLPNRVVVLAETAEMAHEIDVERARSAKERAEERLARAGDPEATFEGARAALLRAATRLNVASKNR